jgi:hypothetical protein
MSEYDAGFNVLSQTIECGIGRIQLLTAEEGLNIKPAQVVDEEKITSSLGILYDNIRWQEKRYMKR